jgi:hypothetical protein
MVVLENVRFRYSPDFSNSQWCREIADPRDTISESESRIYIEYRTSPTPHLLVLGIRANAVFVSVKFFT